MTDVSYMCMTLTFYRAIIDYCSIARKLIQGANNPIIFLQCEAVFFDLTDTNPKELLLILGDRKVSSK